MKFEFKKMKQKILDFKNDLVEKRLEIQFETYFYVRNWSPSNCQSSELTDEHGKQKKKNSWVWSSATGAFW